MRKKLAIDLTLTQPYHFSNPYVKLGHFNPKVKEEAHKNMEFQDKPICLCGQRIC